MKTDSFGYYLLNFSCLNRSILKLLSNKVNLSVTEFRILLTFTSNEIQTVSNISKCLSIQKGRISPLVQELVEKTILRRKTSREDRRVVHLYLTTKGKRLLEQMFNDFEGLFKEAITDLAAPDRENLRTTFKRILESLSDVGDEIESV